MVCIYTPLAVQLAIIVLVVLVQPVLVPVVLCTRYPGVQVVLLSSTVLDGSYVPNVLSLVDLVPSIVYQYW